MTQVQLLVPEVHCDHCKMSLEGAVAALPGIARVEVAIADATIDVDFDDDAVELDRIKNAIEEQGYAVFG